MIKKTTNKKNGQQQKKKKRESSKNSQTKRYVYLTLYTTRHLIFIWFHTGPECCIEILLPLPNPDIRYIVNQFRVWVSTQHETQKIFDGGMTQVYCVKFNLNDEFKFCRPRQNRSQGETT